MMFFYYLFDFVCFRFKCAKMKGRTVLLSRLEKRRVRVREKDMFT